MSPVTLTEPTVELLPEPQPTMPLASKSGEGGLPNCHVLAVQFPPTPPVQPLSCASAGADHIQVHVTTKAVAIRFVAFMIRVPQQKTHFRRRDRYGKV